MLRKLSRHVRQNAVAWLALFVALGGTSAYAANTVFSTDIVDGEVKAPDIAANAVDSARVRDNTINTFDVHSFIGDDIVDETITGADVADTSSLRSDDIFEEALNFSNTLGRTDLATGSVGSDEVLDNALTGADINEASLAPTTTATFANPNTGVQIRDAFTHVVSRSVPAGNYAVWAVANLSTGVIISSSVRDTACELRSNGNWIGGATDRRGTSQGQISTISLSPNGLTSFGAGGGTISLWCRMQGETTGSFDYGHMLIQRIDGFF
jgi:hypothetical protein